MRKYKCAVCVHMRMHMACIVGVVCLSSPLHGIDPNKDGMVRSNIYVYTLIKTLLDRLSIFLMNKYVKLQRRADEKASEKEEKKIIVDVYVCAYSIAIILAKTCQ